ncbi:MAG: hypothetical protein WAN11_03335 [Syntrophobacteraceae bacterium]
MSRRNTFGIANFVENQDEIHHYFSRYGPQFHIRFIILYDGDNFRHQIDGVSEYSVVVLAIKVFPYPIIPNL